MELRRLDDYQSWALEIGGKRVVIDPWLSDEMSLPPGHWLFGRRREAPKPITTWLPVDALVLSAHFSDHLHPATLKQLPPQTPVFASKVAAKHARKLGFTNVTALSDADQATVLPGLTVTAIAPNFPYSHNSIGFLFEGDGSRLYFETHIVNFERAKTRIGEVDCLVAPMQSVRVAGIPFVQSLERSVEVAKVLKPKQWLPTGDDPKLAHGLFHSLLISYRGELPEFAPMLKAAGLETQFLTPAPGEPVRVQSSSALTSTPSSSA